MYNIANTDRHTALRGGIYADSIALSMVRIESFVESAGATVAPLRAGLIAVRSSLGNAILYICISTWALCTVFLAVAAYLVPGDIATLRAQMRERADRERALQTGRGAGG